MSSFRLGSFSTSPTTAAQGEPCLAIGAACSAAMEGIARQPEAEGKIRDIIMETAESLKALGVRCERHHAAEAIGLFAAAQVDGVARQPEAKDKLKDLAELCVDLLKDQFYLPTRSAYRWRAGDARPPAATV